MYKELSIVKAGLMLYEDRAACVFWSLITDIPKILLEDRVINSIPEFNKQVQHLG